MKEFMYVAFMVYAILGVCVVAFVVMLLPSLILAAWEYLASKFVGFSFEKLWDESLLKQIIDNFLDEKLHPWLLDVREHYEFLRQQKGRHSAEFEQELIEFMESAVQEYREVNEGRRMPASIRGELVSVDG